ncbi:schlafen-like protein 1 [Actinia tenebrosa]|uniref:Schlafen-like protein 1 n=1 Tax=Actinia tenebrosa TaxID=6105 RepID=A0A6P8I9U8_ACTTE|nr:schlafen-like protein 1 [Actinia tenebrosa]
MDQSSSNNATSSTSSTPSNFSTYVGNLRCDIPVEELKNKLHSLFETVGVSVLVADTQVYRKSWKEPSFGFVVLRDKSSFDLAAEKLNGTKNDEIVFTGKELIISPRRKRKPQLSKLQTTTKPVLTSVRNNSKKGKHKTANNHRGKNSRSHGVAMETSTISNGDTDSSLLNARSSPKNTDPSSSILNSLVPQGKYFCVGQKLGTEDRLTEYKQGGGKYLDYHFKLDVGKYICAFLNSEGGTLLIGVKDDCTVCGTEISNRKREDQLRLQIDKIMKGFNPNVFPNLYSVKFIPVYPISMITSGSCSSSQPGDENSTQLPDTSSNKLLSLSSPLVPRRLPPLNLTSQDDNASGLSTKQSNTDSLSTSKLTPVKSSGEGTSVDGALNENILKVVEISVQSPPRPSGGQRTLYQNHKREVYIRLDGSVRGPLEASEIVEWGRCNMAESLHMEHDYLKQQVHRKQEEITMNLKLVDDVVKQKQFLEDQYKEEQNTLVSEIDKLRTREKEIEGELEQVRKTKSKVCVIM